MPRRVEVQGFGTGMSGPSPAPEDVRERPAATSPRFGRAEPSEGPGGQAELPAALFSGSVCEHRLFAHTKPLVLGPSDPQEQLCT